MNRDGQLFEIFERFIAIFVYLVESSAKSCYGTAFQRKQREKVQGVELENHSVSSDIFQFI